MKSQSATYAVVSNAIEKVKDIVCLYFFHSKGSTFKKSSSEFTMCEAEKTEKPKFLICSMTWKIQSILSREDTTNNSHGKESSHHIITLFDIGRMGKPPFHF